MDSSFPAAPAAAVVANIRAWGAEQPHPSVGRTRALITLDASLLPERNKPAQKIHFIEAPRRKANISATLASEPTRLLRLLWDLVRTRACSS